MKSFQVASLSLFCKYCQVSSCSVSKMTTQCHWTGSSVVCPASATGPKRLSVQACSMYLGDNVFIGCGGSWSWLQDSADPIAVPCATGLAEIAIGQTVTSVIVAPGRAIPVSLPGNQWAIIQRVSPSQGVLDIYVQGYVPNVIVENVNVADVRVACTPAGPFVPVRSGATYQLPPCGSDSTSVTLHVLGKRVTIPLKDGRVTPLTIPSSSALPPTIITFEHRLLENPLLFGIKVLQVSGPTPTPITPPTQVVVMDASADMSVPVTFSCSQGATPLRLSGNNAARQFSLTCDQEKGTFTIGGQSVAVPLAAGSSIIGAGKTIIRQMIDGENVLGLAVFDK